MLDLLADTIAEVTAIRAESEREADRRRREGRERAQRLEADARLRAEAVRSEAAAEVTRQVAGDTAAVRDRAERQAEEVRRLAGERLPDYSARVLQRMRAELRDARAPS